MTPAQRREAAAAKNRAAAKKKAEPTQTPAIVRPTPLSPTPDLAATTQESPFVFASDAANPDKLPEDRWRLIFGGYIRMQYRAVQNDDRAGLIGRNDGFLLANARPSFRGVMKNGLGFQIQLEAAANLDNPDRTSPEREMLVRPRDVFISYQPFSYLELQLGQFKPPFDLEGLMSTGAIAFVDRSVGSLGVNPFDTLRPQLGLSIDRQVGAQLKGQYFPMSETNDTQGFGVKYAVALTNGTSSNRTVNDNDALAYYGRLSLHWADMVTLGGAAYTNALLQGTAPDLVNQTRTGWTADILANAYGVHFMASVTQQKDDTDLFDEDNPVNEVTFSESLAYQVQLGYRIPVVNLMPTVRYATYDPTSAFNQLDTAGAGLDPRDIDTLTYITMGLNYVPDTYPITVMVNYVLTGEQEGSESLDNNLFEALVQLTW